MHPGTQGAPSPIPRENKFDYFLMLSTVLVSPGEWVGNCRLCSSYYRMVNTSSGTNLASWDILRPIMESRAPYCVLFRVWAAPCGCDAVPLTSPRSRQPRAFSQSSVQTFFHNPEPGTCFTEATATPSCGNTNLLQVITRLARREGKGAARSLNDGIPWSPTELETDLLCSPPGPSPRWCQFWFLVF